MNHRLFRAAFVGLLLSALTVVTATAQQATTSAASSASAASDERPTNIILLIPDGFGPASATMARDYLRKYEGIRALALDSIQTGSVRTFSTSSRVTDSAAGATAFATGHKTYNGAIAVDTLKQPVATILQAANRRGMATGLVATSRVTHATPASFSAHVVERWMENEIAEQQIESGADVILGGGKRHFVPSSVDGSRREDDRNLMDEATATGYQVVESRDDLMGVREGPVLGLFSMSHMDYEIDRDPAEQPSLAEMTEKTLELLSTDEDGYFVMIEGSRIDHAGHGNDAAAHLHDILAYNEAVAAALSYAKRDSNTLVVSVSDHETGGLSLGRDIKKEDGVTGVYAWHPEVLHRIQGSHGAMFDAAGKGWNALGEDATQSDSVAVITDVLADMAAIDDVTAAETEALGNQTGSYGLNYVISDIIGRRAVIGWTTRGHTAVDVNLYAFGPGSEHFRGNMDNTRVGEILAMLMDADLDALTSDLREAMEENESEDSAPAATGSEE